MKNSDYLLRPELLQKDAHLISGYNCPFFNLQFAFTFAFIQSDTVCSYPTVCGEKKVLST